MKRRAFLEAAAILSVSGQSALPSSSHAPQPEQARTAAPARAAKRQRVAVVGAGAFGGWTALSLLRRGARVTLLDAWGAGNSRASSGGETRIIRAIYGGERRYSEWAARALALWKENEGRFGRALYHRTGALWMFHTDDSYARNSLPHLAAAGLHAREISLAEAAKRYPQVSFDGIRTVFIEEEAGYLLARQACEAVRQAFVREGGEYRQLAARPGEMTPSAKAEGGTFPVTLTLSDESSLAADACVFACGPWLGSLFPDVVGNLIRPTRQEVFFFGTPAGDPRFTEEAMPVWVEIGETFTYGIPGNDQRGFKIADDTHGEPFDPTTGDRTPSAAGIAWARKALAARFPALSGAPLLEARVCQYENTPDGHYLIDRLPHASNVWLVGGGSGHGFKMGPVLGEHVARLVLEEASPDPFFSLSRFAAPGQKSSTP